jgi:hypothetical protein
MPHPPVILWPMAETAPSVWATSYCFDKSRVAPCFNMNFERLSAGKLVERIDE